ncbi:MAG: recombination-associated protein RdgC [Desulfobacterales bacterium]|jgi:DNA recombination-dependent growth factor C|nr:recombination-associated protein RdgC [Desulfobacterales bacterium]
MGLLSSSVSISRYRVEGKIEKPVTEAVAKGLRKNAIADIDEDISEKSVGWTSFENPFSPNFETSSFLFGNFFIFSLRVDRKSIPAKLLKKYVTLETFKRLDKTKRRFLSKDEKKAIKDKVITDLAIRIPSTPNVYDLIWDYEKSNIYFFSSLRSSNEDLESLFKRSFDLSLVRIFPYTAAELLSDLSDQERDVLIGLSPIPFSD